MPPEKSWRKPPISSYSWRLWGQGLDPLLPQLLPAHTFLGDVPGPALTPQGAESSCGCRLHAHTPPSPEGLVPGTQGIAPFFCAPPFVWSQPSLDAEGRGRAAQVGAGEVLLPALASDEGGARRPGKPRAEQGAFPGGCGRETQENQKGCYRHTGGCLGPRLPCQPPSTLSQMSRQAPMAWLESLPDLMARMQPNCVWTDSILCCLCTATLLNSICDVKPQLIMEKQIRFSKLNFLLPLPVRRLTMAFAQRGVLPTCSVTHPFEPNPSDPPGSNKVPPAWPPQPLYPHDARGISEAWGGPKTCPDLDPSGRTRGSWSPQAPFVFLVWILMGQAAGEEGDDALPARPHALSRAVLSPDGLPDHHVSWLGL